MNDLTHLRLQRLQLSVQPSVLLRLLLHLLLVVLCLVIKESIRYLEGRPRPDQTVILRAVINLFREGLPDKEPTPTVTLRPTINQVVLRSDSDQEEAFDVKQFSDSWFMFGNFFLFIPIFDIS